MLVTRCVFVCLFIVGAKAEGSGGGRGSVEVIIALSNQEEVIWLVGLPPVDISPWLKQQHPPPPIRSTVEGDVKLRRPVKIL